MNLKTLKQGKIYSCIYDRSIYDPKYLEYQNSYKYIGRIEADTLFCFLEYIGDHTIKILTFDGSVYITNNGQYKEVIE